MTETDDELLALCDAATPGPWFWALDSNDNRTSLMRSGTGEYVICPQADASDYGLRVDPYNDVSEEDAAYIAAASPDRVKALVMRVREAERDRDDAVETALALEKRLKRAEEALRRISAVSDVGGHIAAAYFNPAGEGE